MKIDELYFGVMMLDPNHNSTPLNRNLFDLGGIRRDIAKWLTMDSVVRQDFNVDPLAFCFSGVRARTEYEMYLAPIYQHERGYKIDLFNLYVLPNQEYLLSLLRPLTKEDGQKWLKAHTR